MLSEHMICDACGHANAAENVYCARCGRKLQALHPEDQHPSTDAIRDTVRAVLRDEYQSRDLVETRLSEDVVTRVLGWAKMAGIVIGVPVAVALAALGITTVPTIYSIHTFLADGSTKITKLTDDVKNAQNKIGADNASAKEVEKRLQKLKKSIAASQNDLAQLTALKNKYAHLEPQLQALQAFSARLTGTNRTVSNANLQSQSLTAGRIVFIQYADNATRAAMIQLQADLSRYGVVAPGVEHVSNAKDGNVVKYFRAEDEPVAEAIKKIANSSLSRNCRNKPQITNLEKLRAAHPSPATQLEVWVTSTCLPVGNE